MKTKIITAFAGGIILGVLIWGGFTQLAMPDRAVPPPRTGALPVASTLDVPVLDQDGRPLTFYADLVRGKTVAIDFIYTSCPTFCQPLSANFGQVREDLATRIGTDIELISISLDPETDTPARLKTFSAQFNRGPGWTFVTGARPDIARLVYRLGQPLSDPADHSPLVLIHNDRVGGWSHIDGTDPAAVRDALVAAAGPAPTAESASNADAAQAARRYMQNPLLRTQDDKPVHFFDDLLRGKTVMINFMLTNCQNTCPTVTANLAQVQKLLGDRVGRSINMVSLSVDPGRDQPEQLREFAANFGAGPGWYFLTGEPPEIEPLLRRLAAYTTDPIDHNTVLILGNVETGEWTKMFAMSEPSDIAHALLALQSPR
jgi:cytochrome oxidase Cu insertion factor (SCO1/SenC/PrrC family)